MRTYWSPTLQQHVTIPDAPAGIVIILPEYNRGKWQVNLTDHHAAWGRRHFTEAGQALAYVRQLQARGHRVIFSSALADLLDDVQAAVAA